MSEKSIAVSLVAKAKQELDRGSWIEVECTESAVRHGSVMKGKWVFYLAKEGAQGEAIRSQILVWRTLEPREVVTGTGLLGFAIELDVNLPQMPLKTGQKGFWRR